MCSSVESPFFAVPPRFLGLRPTSFFEPLADFWKNVSSASATTLMLAATVSVISVRFGDVLGTALYDKYGNFFICVIAVTVVYALILPMLLLVPKQLTSTSDGQKP